MQNQQYFVSLMLARETKRVISFGIFSVVQRISHLQGVGGFHNLLGAIAGMLKHYFYGLAGLGMRTVGKHSGNDIVVFCLPEPEAVRVQSFRGLQRILGRLFGFIGSIVLTGCKKHKHRSNKKVSHDDLSMGAKVPIYSIGSI